MGVKECGRKGCTSIMCDNYSNETGYLCSSCFSELEDTEPRCVADVTKFMNTPKPNELDKDFSLKKLFGQHNN